MASTYSSSLRLELMATGDQSGTWGDTTNTNLGTLLEQAITGVLSVAQGDVANLTLTTVDGGSDQARNAVVNVTGALTGARNVVVQTANKLYLARNSTSGGFALTFKTAAGTGVDVAPGTARWIYSDGTNVVDGLAYAWSSTTTALRPNTSDGMALGTSALMWADLFLASGGVINWNNGDVTITHSANTLAFAGASSGYTFDGPVSTSSGGLSASSTAAGTLATLTSTDAGATAGPSIDLYRDSATPTANDIIGNITFNGEDSAGNKQEYASIEAVIADATSGSEDAAVNHYAVVGGTRTKIISVGPNLDLAAIGQIKFPGTQNPSSNVNTLDDYEEGTWTPGMTFNNSATGVTYSLQSGAYTKVGNICMVAAHIVLTSNGTGVGAARVTGLPFTSSGAAPAGMCSMAGYNNFSGVSGIPMLLVDASATTISLFNGGATSSSAMTDTNVTNTADFYFGGVYQTAS